MKITNGRLLELLDGLQRIAACEHPVIANRVANALGKLRDSGRALHETRMAISMRHAIRTDDDQPEFAANGDIKIAPERRAEFRSEMDELLTEEIDVPDIRKVERAHLVKHMKISGETMFLLGDEFLGGELEFEDDSTTGVTVEMGEIKDAK